MAQSHSDARNRAAPFLARFAVPRPEGSELPGVYSEEEGMWLVNTGSGHEPIIEVASDLAELTTKTKVDTESDDSAPAALLELTTKAKAGTENDDQRSLAVASMALTTKTAAQLEQDDIEPRGLGMW